MMLPIWRKPMVFREYSVAGVCCLLLLAGCDSDVSVSVNTGGMQGNGNPSGDNNPCTSYVNANSQTIRGAWDGTDCTYSSTFVDSENPILEDITFPALAGAGAHIFRGSLFVGRTYESDADLAAAGIAEGGDGPTLRVEAGATLAFQNSEKFFVINRGARIRAVGTASRPITFTSLTDVSGDLSDDPQAVQQWGGLVINGFGVTNQCQYTGSVTYGADDLTVTNDTLQLAGECHVDSEGSTGADENQYGGDNNDDNSGRLEYVIVKHTGATVGNGDELNGITFAGVGRDTVVRNLQVYSTFDDGIELFGGAVNLENLLVLYARDDSIDIDEGYAGRIDRALIVQSANDGNHCVEADGISSFSDLTNQVRSNFKMQGINSRVLLRGLTCITSANGASTATHDPGAGLRFREGITARVENALVIGSFTAADTTANNDNYCLRVDGTPLTEVTVSAAVLACAEHRVTAGAATGNSAITLQNVSYASVAALANPTAASNTDLQLLGGMPPVFSLSYQTMRVGGEALAGAPVAPASGSAPAYIGALEDGGTNPFTGWTFGLVGERLWISN